MKSLKIKKKKATVEHFQGKSLKKSILSFFIKAIWQRFYMYTYFVYQICKLFSCFAHKEELKTTSLTQEQETVLY